MLTDGQRMRLARLGRGWTLQILADKCGHSLSYLSKMENDEREVPEMLVDMLNLKQAIWYEKLRLKLRGYNGDFDEVLSALKNALYLH